MIKIHNITMNKYQENINSNNNLQSTTVTQQKLIITIFIIVKVNTKKSKS